jgi:hypothetical protein
MTINAPSMDKSAVPKATAVTRGQCYKTSYSRNLWIVVISWIFQFSLPPEFPLSPELGMKTSLNLLPVPRSFYRGQIWKATREPLLPCGAWWQLAAAVATADDSSELPLSLPDPGGADSVLSRTQCYITSQVCNLQMFMMCWSIFPWQVFRA